MIPSEITRWVCEFVCEYNDGYTQEEYGRKLTEVRDYIDGVLIDHCISCGKPLVIPQHLDFIDVPKGKMCMICVERGKNV